MVMGLGMKVSVSMSLFVINLVGKGTIREARDENIEERGGICPSPFP
jgi:hypothetical protein